MPSNVYEGSQKLNITQTDNSIQSSQASKKFLLGVLVSQASNTPTIAVADSGGTIMNTLTPAAGTFYPLPCQIDRILTVTISGTVDATIFYGPN